MQAGSLPESMGCSLRKFNLYTLSPTFEAQVWIRANTLQPQGEVTNLKDSMTVEYDNFFTNQPKVQFDECLNGYIESAESPFDVNAFSGSQKLLF